MKRKTSPRALQRSFIVSDPTGEMQRQIAKYIEAHPRTVNSATAKSDVIAIALDLLMKQDEQWAQWAEEAASAAALRNAARLREEVQQ